MHSTSQTTEQHRKQKAEIPVYMEMTQEEKFVVINRY